jgi:prepilin-type N-terminal cleavage/methylation domain-containing protein
MQYTVIHKNGFTLVETLVAIAVLLLAIIGPMTIAQKGIQNAQFANEQFTAVFLAQEALEAVRKLRDEKALDRYAGDSSTDTSDWLPSSSAGCESGSGCAYNPSSDSFASCSNSSNCRLYIDSNSGKYSHDIGGSQSPFTRTVKIGSYVAGGWQVAVTVSWNNKIFSTQRSVVLQTWIYDHYQRYEN